MFLNGPLQNWGARNGGLRRGACGGRESRGAVLAGPGRQELPRPNRIGSDAGAAVPVCGPGSGRAADRAAGRLRPGGRLPRPFSLSHRRLTAPARRLTSHAPPPGTPVPDGAGRRRSPPGRPALQPGFGSARACPGGPGCEGGPWRRKRLRPGPRPGTGGTADRRRSARPVGVPRGPGGSRIPRRSARPPRLRERALQQPAGTARPRPNRPVPDSRDDGLRSWLPRPRRAAPPGRPPIVAFAPDLRTSGAAPPRDAAAGRTSAEPP